MMQNFWAIKIYSRNYMAGTRGKKKSLLKIMKLPQKILAKIFQPKKSWKRKFQTPKFLWSSCHLISGVPPKGSSLVPQSRVFFEGLNKFTSTGRSRPSDKERGGGGISWGPSLKKKFQAFGLQSGLKIRGRSLTSRYSVMVANPWIASGLFSCEKVWAWALLIETGAQ